MQRRLHHWAVDESGRRFDDLFNLVHHPCFLTVAWERVRNNPGRRTAGVDGVKPHGIGVYTERFLRGIREDVKSRGFRPSPVREVQIPKAGGKLRSLGIPTAADRVVQASLKLVLEPIFEADFLPCAYGFRPRRRAQDAIAEIHFLGTRGFRWVFEADIAKCFDEIDHGALMQRVCGRVSDKRVLHLVRAFLKSGILSEDAVTRFSDTGTPQGGILSPLLANIVLSGLDQHFDAKRRVLSSGWAMQRHLRAGGAKYRIVRYADDFVVMVSGSRQHAEALWDEVAEVLSPMGLRLSEEKTRVCHIDEGFDFLGFRIQRCRKRGTAKTHIYTWPSKKALNSIKTKVRELTRRNRHRTLADLLHQLTLVLRGWCHYFKHGVSKATFQYLDHFMWWRVTGWIRKRHPKLGWKTLRRRFWPDWQIREGKLELFRPHAVPVTRYRYR
ncbi:group II intron reverse transcriptase/maturase, partial [Streptomyces daliensis]|nr:group II intron reverse transcriptase/maturase [Streptomyces daliensis]